MKKLTILLSLTFIFSKINQDFQSQFQSESIKANDENVKILINLYDNIKFEIFRDIKNQVENQLNVLVNKTEWEKLNISKLEYQLLNETCKNYLTEHILTDMELLMIKFYYSLLLSPKQKNDLSGFKKCLKFDSKNEIKDYNKSYDTHMEYIILRIDKSDKNSTNFDANNIDILFNSFLTSFCLPNNINYCNESNLETLFAALQDYFKNFFWENNGHDFKIYIFNKDLMSNKDKNNKYIKLIPLYILLLHLLLSFIGNSKKFRKYKIFQYFNLRENLEESFNINLAITKYNNFKGITYINCLIGISMIFMIFGSVFLKMINLPIINYNEESLYFLFKNFFYIIIFIGIRYSPRILISCSAFTLTYKLISYLNNNNNSFWKFLIYQIHKYFYLIIVILFFYISLYYLKSESTPSWYFFYKTLILNIEKNNLVLYILPIYHFKTERNQYQFFQYQNFIDYLWLPYNEIILFLIGSLLIFICCKFNWRLDLICIISFFALIISKLIYFNFIEKNLYSTLYFYYFNYGIYMTNPIFNLSYLFIGIFFGLINYCIQNLLNYIEEKPNLNDENSKSNEDKKNQYLNELEGKSYLQIPCYIFHIIKKKKINKFLNILILLIIFIPLLLHYFFLYILGNNFKEIKDELNWFINQKIIMVIYILDIEIFVLIIHFFIIYYYKWINVINSFLNLDLWRFFNKIYFTFIVCLNLVNLYIFYHDNNRLSLNFETIFLYSIINGISIIIISCLSYLFFELPYKKLIKSYYKEKSLNNNDSNNNSNDIENDEEDEESDDEN